jgi:hypothetical protein
MPDAPYMVGSLRRRSTPGAAGQGRLGRAQMAGAAHLSFGKRKTGALKARSAEFVVSCRDEGDNNHQREAQYG